MSLVVVDDCCCCASDDLNTSFFPGVPSTEILSATFNSFFIFITSLFLFFRLWEEERERQQGVTAAPYLVVVLLTRHTMVGAGSVKVVRRRRRSHTQEDDISLVPMAERKETLSNKTLNAHLDKPRRIQVGQKEKRTEVKILSGYLLLLFHVGLQRCRMVSTDAHTHTPRERLYLFISQFIPRACI